MSKKIGVRLQDSGETSGGQDGKAHSGLTSTSAGAGARLGGARGLGGVGACGSSTSGLSSTSGGTSGIEQAVAADGHEAGVRGEGRALGGERGQLILVAAEPGQHLGLVGGVVGAEAGGNADLAGVGLRVLRQVGDDGGRRRGEGRDDAQGLGRALAEVAAGGGSCAREDGADVEGSRGRGDEGEDGDGRVGTHGGRCVN